MAADSRSLGKVQVPSFVGVFNPLAHRLLGLGVPLGPNALITIRGRKSGVARTTPVAVVEIGGRRWVIGTFGEVNWVRNLRAAGEATITIRGRSQAVTAVELSRDQAAAFFSDELAPYIRHLPLGVGRVLIRALGAGDILRDPKAAAAGRPVFELRAAA